jgi:hypothetical protein
LDFNILELTVGRRMGLGCLSLEGVGFKKRLVCLEGEEGERGSMSGFRIELGI